MKRHMVLVIILILIGLFVAFSAAAHPENSPLTFRKHLTDDGRVIYSNIPKACFSEGVLTCDRLHPIFGTPTKMKGTETNKKIIARPKTPPSSESAAISTDIFGPPVKKSGSGICHPKEDGTHYEKTFKNYESFNSMDACLDSGGRESKN